MIRSGLRIHVAPGKRHEALRIIRSLLEPTRVQGGCLACRAYQDIEDPGVLALVLEWSNSDDLDRYLQSEDSRKYLALMELASQQPEIWFDTVVIRQGLERLAAALGGAVDAS